MRPGAPPIRATRPNEEVHVHRCGEKGVPRPAPVQGPWGEPKRTFAWKSRPASRRQRDDLVLLAHVRSSFALSNETYGSPRMTHELRDQGLKAGRRRVARLMRENGLRARQPRRFKRTTDSRHAFPVAPNLLDQDFSAERPNEKWGADISYIWTQEGWLYLAVVIDLYARRVVGWALETHLQASLATAALDMAITTRRPAPGSLIHLPTGACNMPAPTTRPC